MIKKSGILERICCDEYTPRVTCEAAVCGNSGYVRSLQNFGVFTVVKDAGGRFVAIESEDGNEPVVGSKKQFGKRGAQSTRSQCGHEFCKGICRYR